MTTYWRWLMAAGLLVLVGCGELDETVEWDELDDNGCYPGELYDPVDDVCYIECDSDAECEALEAEIYGEAQAFESEPDPEAYAEPAPTAVPQTDPEPVDEALPEPAGSAADDEGLVPFAEYAVDEQLNLTLTAVVDDTAVDTAEYEAIWAIIRDLLPPDVLVEEVRQYQVFTDGPDETLAYVEPLPDDPDHWLMAIDTADVQVVNGALSDDVIHTIVHEFAHILTLENDQVPPDTGEACQTFFTGEGCAREEAYINQFFFAFWDDIFDQLLDIENIEDQLAYEDALYEFYEQYEDRFVTDYAATNPGEDIAESFTLFVLNDAPNGRTMADDKVRFFYDYPRMVAIRDRIRSQLER